jgi:hypothetical protein
LFLTVAVVILVLALRWFPLEDFVSHWDVWWINLIG